MNEFNLIQYYWICIYRIAVGRPGAEFHVAGLLVEREILDVDLAKGLVDGRRLPRDRPVVSQDRLRHDGHLVVAVGAGINLNRNRHPISHQE